MKKIFKKPFGIAATSVSLGIAGDAFNSSSLGEAGQAAGKFVGPAVNISAGAQVINIARGIRKKKL